MATKNINTAGDSGAKKTETKSDTKKTSTSKTEAKTEPKSKSETKSVAATKTATKADPALKAKTESATKSDTKKTLSSKNEPAEKSKSSAKTEPAGKAKAESSSKSETKSEAASKTEVKSKSTTKAEPSAKAKTEPAGKAKAESSSKSETKSEAAPKSEAKTQSSSKSEQKKPATEKKEAKPEQIKSEQTRPATKTEATTKSDAKKTATEKKTPAKTVPPHEEVEKVDDKKEVKEQVAEENQTEIKITLDKQKIAETGKKLAELEEYVPEPVKKKLSKAKKIVIAAVSFMVVMLTAAWTFGGKPIVEIGAEGFTVYPTEDPIVYHIPEYLAGEYPPETHYSDINGTGGVFTTTIVFSQDKVTISGSMSGLDNSGGSQKKSSSEEKAADTEKAPASEKASEKIAKVKNGTRGSNSEADRGHPENNPLYLGNPTDSLAKTEMNTNYLMVKDQYTLSYNTTTLCPNWAAWHLDKANMGAADRSDDFRPDEELPTEWYGVKKADYQYNKYGFDRGHVCPSADRTATKLDNSMTFLMTNMVPQSPDNNRVIWMHFECYERELVNAGNELYIIAGPYGTGGTSQKGTFDNIPISLKSKEVLYMNVPAYTWKVLIAIPEGDDDISRIGKDAIVIAINVPNEMGMGKTGDWDQFICTVDDIEELTGYDFFELLPDDVEDVLESRKYVYTK